MRRSRALLQAPLSSALLLVPCACSVDHRHLEHGPGDSGYASSANGGGAAGATDEADASSAGKGDAPGDLRGLVDGCADLDTDGVADCQTTLLENATFDRDTSAWKAASSATLSWAPKNALGDLPSGSALLSASAARPSSEQCVKVEGKQLVIAYANAFVVAATGGGSSSGQAELEVSFFDTDDCSGERAGYFETPPSSMLDEWTTIQAGGVALDGTRSVSLALVGLKPSGATQLDVYFDNVMLKVKEL